MKNVKELELLVLPGTGVSFSPARCIFVHRYNFPRGFIQQYVYIQVFFDFLLDIFGWKEGKTLFNSEKRYVTFLSIDLPFDVPYAVGIV